MIVSLKTIIEIYLGAGVLAFIVSGILIFKYYKEVKNGPAIPDNSPYEEKQAHLKHIKIICK